MTRSRLVHPLATVLLLAAVTAGAVLRDDPPLPEDTLPAVLDGAVPFGLPPDVLDGDGATEAQVALGRRLFFDPLLSVDGTVACASCHEPERGFAGSEPLSLGVGGRRTDRNAPTLFNRALGVHFMWDGQASSLEQQVLLPIENPKEMGADLDQIITRLSGHDEYAPAFERAFGGAPSRAHLASALASFLRRLLYADSGVDRFRAGEFSALSDAARTGMWIYESSGRCWRCHSGPNFSDERFHNTGVGVVDGEAQAGRSAITGDEQDAGSFKTPTLRGLTLTAPYMHDGSLATLREVVEFYNEGGRANSLLSEHVLPLDMSEQEITGLVAFLEALSPPPGEGVGEASGRSGSGSATESGADDRR